MTESIWCTCVAAAPLAALTGVLGILVIALNCVLRGSPDARAFRRSARAWLQLPRVGPQLALSKAAPGSTPAAAPPSGGLGSKHGLSDSCGSDASGGSGGGSGGRSGGTGSCSGKEDGAKTKIAKAYGNYFYSHPARYHQVRIMLRGALVLPSH